MLPVFCSPVVPIKRCVWAGDLGSNEGTSSQVPISVGLTGWFEFQQLSKFSFYTYKTPSNADSDGKNLLENRKQLTGYSASMMEVAKWKMKECKKYNWIVCHKFIIQCIFCGLMCSIVFLIHSD